MNIQIERAWIIALIALIVTSTIAFGFCSGRFEAWADQPCESCVYVADLLDDLPSESERRCGLDATAESWSDWHEIFNAMHGVEWVERRRFDGREWTIGYWRVPTFLYFADGFWCVNRRLDHLYGPVGDYYVENDLESGDSYFDENLE